MVVAFSNVVVCGIKENLLVPLSFWDEIAPDVMVPVCSRFSYDECRVINPHFPDLFKSASVEVQQPQKLVDLSQIRSRKDTRPAP